MGVEVGEGAREREGDVALTERMPTNTGCGDAVPVARQHPEPAQLHAMDQGPARVVAHAGEHRAERRHPPSQVYRAARRPVEQVRLHERGQVIAAHPFAQVVGEQLGLLRRTLFLGLAALLRGDDPRAGEGQQEAALLG